MDKTDIFLGLVAIGATAAGGALISKHRKKLGTVLLIIGVSAFSALLLKT